MKFSKSLFLAFAGLGLFACSNEDVVEQGPQFNGNGVVSVKIVKPETRALSEGTTVDITGDITINLTGKTVDGNRYDQSLTINSSDLESSTELKFWNVGSPEKLTATINGGKGDYTTTEISTLWEVEPANIPAYGEVNQDGFTLTDKSEKPDMDNDNKTEQGAEDGDENKTYQMYEATVTMAIPVARLEVGDISFQEPSDGKSIYATLEYGGCYLDNYAAKGGKFVNNAFTAGSGFNDYDFGSAVLKHGLETPLDFVNNEIEEAGSFNFYAGTANPQFKLYFGRATAADPAHPVTSPRYAMIKSYKDESGKDVIFKNGHIYQITGVSLSDDNIIGDEGGNTAFGVDVTVTEAVWQVKTIGTEWVGDKK